MNNLGQQCSVMRPFLIIIIITFSQLAVIHVDIGHNAKAHLFITITVTSFRLAL